MLGQREKETGNLRERERKRNATSGKIGVTYCREKKVYEIGG